MARTIRSHSSRRSVSSGRTRIERRVGGGATLGRRLPDVPRAPLQQLLDEGLEQLHDVDLAAPQRGRVARPSIRR